MGSNKARFNHASFKSSVFWLLLIFSASLYAKEPLSIVVGVAPEESALLAAHNWVPLLRKMSKDSEYRFVFRTARSILEFERNLQKQVYDVAYMNPYQFINFSREDKYKAFAVSQSNRTIPLLFAHRDDDIDSIEDLDGELVLFPSPVSIGATVVPKLELEKRQISIRSNYSLTHDSVYKHVAYKVNRVGGGTKRTFELMDSLITNRLKIIWKSDGIPPFAFAFSTKVKQTEKNKIERLFVNASKDKAYLEMFKRLGLGKLMVVNDHYWNDFLKDIDLLNSAKSAYEDNQSDSRRYY